MNLPASHGQLRASLMRWALVLVPGTILLGYLSSLFSGSGADDPWFAALDKPAIFPPPAVFGIVWTILYAMIGFAAAIVASARGAIGRGIALVLFAIQLALNLAWSPIFFGAHEMSGALVLLVVLIVAVSATTAQFFRIRRLAGWLMVPYAAWILFAAVLNWQFLKMNPDADGATIPADGSVERVLL